MEDIAAGSIAQWEVEAADAATARLTNVQVMDIFETTHEHQSTRAERALEEIASESVGSHGGTRWLVTGMEIQEAQ